MTERASMINGSGLSGYGGMTADQMSGLVNLLDDTTAGGTIKRPESQSTGYSLAESDVPPSERKEEEGDQPADNSNKLVAHNPGGIYVPNSVTDRQTLPQPSGATKIVTGTVSTLGGATAARKKPKGNDIWSTDEVETEANIAPAPKLKAPQTAAPAPAPVVQAPTSTSSNPPAPVASAVSVDRRTSPEYDILYKQTNTAEDVYLSMDFTRDGSTAMSCDSLAVKVQLPLCDKGVSDIELDVDTFVMTLRTRDYLLKAPLPEPCIPKKGKAQWDEGKKVLTVTLSVDTSDRKVKVM